MAGSTSDAFQNGVGTVATFSSPSGLAIDAVSGVAYVADLGHNRVRQIVLATGAVSTLVGSGESASFDGTGELASIGGPVHVAADGGGHLYVLELNAHRIRKVVLATLAVTTVAGNGDAGFVDGPGMNALFNSPRGMVCDASGGHAYVADTGNHRIRKIVFGSAGAGAGGTSGAVVSTLAGSSAASATNGGSAMAGFDSPTAVALDPSGALLFVADRNNRLIRQIDIAAQTVSTLAGSGKAGAADGVGLAADFSVPYALASDARGHLYVGDAGAGDAAGVIRRVLIATRAVTTIAGAAAASAAWADGFGTNARVGSVSGVAVDARGNLVFADTSNARVRVAQAVNICPTGASCAAGARAPLVCAPGYV
jgi:DNA-binding beta-propeller fold protein YncE